MKLKEYFLLIWLVFAMAVPFVSMAGTIIQDRDSEAINNLSLDMARATVSRIGADHLVFSIFFNGEPDPDHFRLMIDVDGPASGEPSTGADYMIEGEQFFRYADGVSAWSWNAIEPPSVLFVDRTLVYTLPALPALRKGQWVMETTRADLSVADRLPADGFIPFDISHLPEYEPGLRFSPGDPKNLPENQNYSLGIRFDVELKSIVWEPVDTTEVPVLFSWTPVFSTSPVPLQIIFRDMVSGKHETAVPSQLFTNGSLVRAEGTNLDLVWTILLEKEEAGRVKVQGELKSSEDRCVRVRVGSGVNPSGWTWHEDTRFEEVVEPDSAARSRTCPIPLGGDERISVYPLGVISSTGGSICVETDLAEPRIYEILEEPQSAFFGIQYDLGMTMRTSNFPGRATFSCAFISRGPDKENAFRRALFDLYRRHTGFARKDSITSASSVLLADMSGVEHIQDFGIGFSVNGQGSSGNRKQDILDLGYMEPWIYWLPMPPDMPRTPANAMLVMQMLAGEPGRRGELAVSTLLGGVQEKDESMAMSFVDVPWNDGAKIVVNTDPDIRLTPSLPINRAMSEWREAQRILTDEQADGIYLDSSTSYSVADYRSAAMGVADYPCTFQSGVLEPCLANFASAWEYVSLLSSALAQDDKILMGAYSCDTGPFFAPLFDVLQEEVRWMEDGTYHRFSDKEMNVRRALAGKKPFCFLLTTDPDNLSENNVHRYFADCLFWGFLPGFFGSSDGASYWAMETLYERDRTLFKTYMPLIQRLADAGWEPVGFAGCDESNGWVECFGTGPVYHVTLRNTQANRQICTLHAELPDKNPVFLNPLNGDCFYRMPSARILLPEEEIALFDVFGADAFGAEIAFMEDWEGGSGEGAANLKTLESVKQELDADVRCVVTHPHPAVAGEKNRLVLEVTNVGDAEVNLSGLKLIGRVFHAGTFSETCLARGQTARAVMEYEQKDAPNNGWLELQWMIERKGKEITCARMIKPRFAPPLEVIPGDFEIKGGRNSAVVRLRIRNHTPEEQAVKIKWEGDFKKGVRSLNLPPLRSESVEISVTSGGLDDGRLFVQVKKGRARLFNGGFNIVFSTEDGNARGTK